MPGDKYGYSLDVGKDLEEEEKAEKGESIKEGLRETEKESEIDAFKGIKKTAREVEEEIKKEAVKEEEEGEDAEALEDEDAELEDYEAGEEQDEQYQDIVFKDAEADRRQIDKLSKEIEESDKRKEIAEMEQEVEDIINGARRAPISKPADSTNFFSLLKKYYIVLFLTIVLVSGFFYLTMPKNLGIVDARAEEAVKLELQRVVTAQIDQEWPLLGNEEKVKLANQRLLQVIKSEQTKDEIRKTAEKYKRYYKDDQNNIYLFKIDPYLYLRQARNLVEHGNLGTELKDGKQFDSLRLAPQGEFVAPKLLPYAEFYFYKILNSFSSISLESSAFYLPVFFGMLSIILFFFIAKKLTNSLSAFFASFLFSIHQLFFSGNFAGYTDTQFLSFFFILLTVFLFVYAIDFKNKPRSLLLFLLIIPTLMLFKFNWNGWFYILVILILFLFVYIISNLIKKILFDKKKQNIKYLAAACIALAILSFYAVNSDYAVRVSNTLRGQTLESGIVTVTESQAITFKGLINAFGGVLLSIIALFEIIYLIARNIKNPNKYELFVLVWFISTLVIAVLSSRYVYFLAPSFILLIGYFLHQIFPYLVKVGQFISINLGERKARVLFSFVIPLLLLFLMSDDIAKTKAVLPEVNDAFYETASFIKENSDEKAVINTWWDFGYVWQYYARRGTNIDGSTFGDYWNSRALLTDNENLARGIFRMIDCGGKLQAYNFVTNKFEQQESIKVLEQILASDRPKAEKTIKDLELPENLINYTHCISPPEAFLIISEDMRDKLASIAYFTELEPATAVKDVVLSRISGCLHQEGTLFCDNGYTVDLKNMDARSNNAHPAGLVFYNDGVKQEVAYNDSRAPFTIIVFKSGDKFKSFLIDSSLKDAMLVRLFAHDSFDKFELAYKTEEPTRILTYRILWQEGVKKEGRLTEEKKAVITDAEVEADAKAEEAADKESEPKQQIIQEIDLGEILVEGLKV